MKQKILLTGATSFLGKQISSSLQEKFEILGTANHIDIERNIQKMDVTNILEIKNIMVKSSPDIIIHSGALVDLARDFETGKKCLKVNTLGTMNLLEVVKEHPPRLFIYISSEEVYGNGTIPFFEDQKPEPPSAYAISKLAGEHFCEFYGKEFNFPVAIIRLGTFYGPYQPLTKYFAQIISYCLKNQPIPTNSAQKKRDYIFIEDAVSLIQKVIEKQLAENTILSGKSVILNGTGGKSYSLFHVIETIKHLTRSTSEVQIGAIPDRITERDEWLADITKAKNMFDWNPKTSLEEGLKKTIEQFKIQN